MFIELTAELIIAASGDSLQSRLRKRSIRRALTRALHRAVAAAAADLTADEKLRKAFVELLLDESGDHAQKRSMLPAPRANIDSSTPLLLRDMVLKSLSEVEASGAEPNVLSRMGVDLEETSRTLEKHILDELAEHGSRGSLLEDVHADVVAAYRHHELLEELRASRGNESPRWHIGGFTLPPAIRLSGRESDLERVLEAADGVGPKIVVIHGMPGVGKTSLAVEAARRISGDAEVPFVSLRGWSSNADGSPAEPVDSYRLLGDLLTACGLTSDELMKSIEMRSAAWRGEVQRHGFRVLVLDNARDAEQVESLLPWSSNCVVLVTSRERMADLDAADVRLDPLSDEHVLELIESSHREPDRDAAVRLAEFTGGLPMACDLVQTALRRYRELPMADVAAEIEEMWSGDAVGESSSVTRDFGNIWAAFGLSFRLLPDRLRHDLLVLARMPGYDLTAFGLAAMTDVSVRQARIHLAELAENNLVQRRDADRWRFHDLTATFLARHARTGLGRDEWRTALRGLLTSQADAAEEARRCFDGAGASEKRRAEAARWLLSERQNIRVALASYASIRDSALTELLLRTALGCGAALLRHGFTEDARGCFTRAAEMARQSGSAAAEAEAWHGLGRVGRMFDDYAEAGASFDRSAALCRQIENRAGLAAALCGQGHVSRLAERFEEAIAHFEASRVEYAAIDDPGGDADCLLGLGEIAALNGRLEEAEEFYRWSLERFQRISDRRGEAEATWGLAEVRRIAGDMAEAERHAVTALEGFRNTADRLGEADGLRTLGELRIAAGRPREAVDLLEESRRIYHRIGDRVGEADALRCLGTAEMELGRNGEAEQHWRMSMALYQAIGSSRAEELSANLRRAAAGSPS